MVVLSGTATVLQPIVSGLKSRNEDTRAKSAKDLQHYVTTELREVVEMCIVNVLSFHFIGPKNVAFVACSHCILK